MKFGLEQHIIDNLITIFEENPNVDKALVFGSRAKGNYRPDSDIDIAIKGQDLNTDDIIAMSVAFEEKGITHKIDLINYHTIKEPDLIDHIDRVGIELYSRWQKTKIGSLPSEWKVLTLDEIKSKEKKAIISGPFGSNISSQYFVANGIPVIRGNNLSLGLGKKFNDDGFVFITEEKANELGTWAVKNDIVFTAVGTIGQVGILMGTEKYPKYIISNKQLRLRVDKEIVSPLFAYYWFASPAMIDTIEQRNTGSSVPLINLSVLKSLYIPIPQKWEQELIVKTLSSLDDKIDLLHRQNKTLEQLAETLFRQWFVEEEDWLGTLSEFLKVQGGYAFKSKDFRESGFAGIIKITNISMGFVDINKCDYVDENAVLNLDEKFKIRTGDFLIAMTGAEIGKIGIVENTNKEIWLNQRVGKLEAKVPYGNLIGYLALKSREGQDHIINACSGSAQENISTTGIEEMVFAKYDEEKAISFGKEASHLFEKITANYKQIKTLSQTRDTLLPKLMSGEVRVNL